MVFEFFFPLHTPHQQLENIGRLLDGVPDTFKSLRDIPITDAAHTELHQLLLSRTGTTLENRTPPVNSMATKS